MDENVYEEIQQPANDRKSRHSLIKVGILILIVGIVFGAVVGWIGERYVLKAVLNTPHHGKVNHSYILNSQVKRLEQQKLALKDFMMKIFHIMQQPNATKVVLVFQSQNLHIRVSCQKKSVIKGSIRLFVILRRSPYLCPGPSCFLGMCDWQVLTEK